MESEVLLNKLISQGNGVLLASAAVEAGISRMQLSKYVTDGLLERTGRGIYVKAGEMNDELYTLQQRAKKIIYSHETALFLHGMTDRTPFRYSATVPSGYKPSENVKESCKVYYIKPALADMGRTELPTGMGHSVFAYDVERTVCDVLRSRNRIDTQFFTEALKNYTSRKDMNLNRLAQYAQELGVYKLLRQYLEVLL